MNKTFHFLFTRQTNKSLSGREDWATWKFAVQTYLELEDLWGAVKPKLKADGSYEAVGPAKHRKARAKVIHLLEPVNYVHIKETTTAKEAWENLEKAFGAPTQRKWIQNFGRMGWCPAAVWSSRKIQANEYSSGKFWNKNY